VAGSERDQEDGSESPIIEPHLDELALAVVLQWSIATFSKVM
jgi:hypothetical protein